MIIAFYLLKTAPSRGEHSQRAWFSSLVIMLAEKQSYHQCHCIVLYLRLACRIDWFNCVDMSGNLAPEKVRVAACRTNPLPAVRQ